MKNGEKIKVLMIETNEDHAYLIKEKLKQSSFADFHCEWAGLLSKGIELFREKKFDVVLLSLFLDDKSEFKVMRKLDGYFGGNVPIVVTTTLEDEETAKKAVRKGAQDYLIKGQLNSDSLSRSLWYAIERHKLVRNLQSLKEEWENIFYHIPNPTVILNCEHTIIMANRATLLSTKMSLEELSGQKCYRVFHNTDKPILDCPTEQILKSRGCDSKEIYVETPDRIFLINCAPILNKAGEIEKIIHSSTDISRLKHAEKFSRSLSDLS